MNKSALKIQRNFDDAATSYDAAASVQADIAARLVHWANLRNTPQNILDIGSGTGFVSEQILKKWPHASLTALDCAPAMLTEAQRKIPHLKTIAGDAASIDMPRRFDAIFSSMMLHWLPEPQNILKRWQSWLKPNGYLYVSLPVNGSFMEWQNLCRTKNIESGLWPMPDENFARDLFVHTEMHIVTADYATAHDFLRHLKTIGAATPHAGHQPASPALLRRMLDDAPRPFRITYRTLFIELKNTGNSDS